MQPPQAVAGNYRLQRELREGAGDLSSRGLLTPSTARAAALAGWELRLGYLEVERSCWARMRMRSDVWGLGL